MSRLILPTVLVAVVLLLPTDSRGSERVHSNGLTICGIIIREMTQGRVGVERGRRISLAIARAANKHFGRATCGDMWLYLAIAHVESGFRINVVNHKNCRGMFQVHAPSWARKFGLRYRDLLNPEINADSGIRVFKYYLGLYKGVVPALSAYHSDHPRASTRYARAVLSTRDKIKRRYAELYMVFNGKALCEKTPHS
jgi:Transglycosylase SLT domain